MNESVVKNRSGWTLHEYIDVPEDRISEYPNVTGAYAIVKVGDRYLIGYNAWRKQWEFPAGGIEEGETARQAAVRELYEETLQDDVALEFKGLFKGPTHMENRSIKRFSLVKKMNWNHLCTLRETRCPRSKFGILRKISDMLTNWMWLS